VTAELAFDVGDEVVHIFSGWSGPVIAIAPWEDDGGMNQGPLVTVRPTRPRPKVYAAGGPVGPEWEGWAPITVTAAELEPAGARKAEIHLVVKLDPARLDEYARELEADTRADGIEPAEDTVGELLEAWAEDLRQQAEVGVGLGKLDAIATTRVFRR
jgi:hypothetical protein